MITTAVPTPLGHAVPGNRWDLLRDIDAPRPSVSVVVPYFEQQRSLDLVLAALEQQTYRAFEVIVADDGSATAPLVRSALDVTVVSQEDRGFRAAAARNLGARAASGDVLCFLDADTVPEPGTSRRSCVCRRWFPMHSRSVDGDTRTCPRWADFRGRTTRSSTSRAG